MPAMSERYLVRKRMLRCRFWVRRSDRTAFLERALGLANLKSPVTLRRVDLLPYRKFGPLDTQEVFVFPEHLEVMRALEYELLTSNK